MFQLVNITYLLNEQKININNSDNNLLIEENITNNRITIKVKALTDLSLYNASLKLDVKFDENSKFFLNGYQSWTDTKEAYLNETEPLAKRAKRFKEDYDEFRKSKDFLLNKFAFDRYGDVLFYNYDKNKLHGYDIFYIKGNNEFFSFNYNYKNAFIIYEINKLTKDINVLSGIKKFKLNKDDEFILYDFSLFNSYDEGLYEFNKFFSYKNTEKIFGYTSWYNYYQNINEEIILRDLEGLDDRFNLFQIDDGYETFVGDWLDINKNKFPNGLEEIVNKIHNKGYKAGIWLAPFVAEEKSKLFNEHKELFKRDSKNNLVKCGGNWSGFYLLDIYNDDARSYIKKCLEYYVSLGFDFFKLDFLYAVSLPRYYTKTKAMVTTEAYKLIKDTLGDKLILGCGALPFSSSDYFDYLRVGPDVSLVFDDVWFMRLAHRERISTKITLQNTIYRSIFNNHLFSNDPDVFLLRSDNIKLTEKQKESLLIINSLFGNVLMTSDNIKTYDIKSCALLNYAFDIFYHAKDKEFRRENDYIIISYNLHDKKTTLKYNTKKGVLENV